MSCGTTTCNCKSGLFLPFILLSASVAVIIGALLKDTLNTKNSLAQQEVAQNAQIAGQQGQQLQAARNHYYSLYSDLLVLAQKDPQSGAIAQKYGIRINQPTTGAAAAPVAP